MNLFEAINKQREDIQSWTMYQFSNHNNEVDKKIAASQEKTDEKFNTFIEYYQDLKKNVSTPLWHTLLSEGAKKVTPPNISFNGVIGTKQIVPLPEDPGFNEGVVGYVRIGDDIGKQDIFMTCGGVYHPLIQLFEDASKMLSINFEPPSFLEQVGLESLGTGLNNLFPSFTSYALAETGNYVIYDSEYRTLLIDWINQGFDDDGMILNAASSSLQYPMAFSINHDFIYQNQHFKAGFYTLYITTNVLKMWVNEYIQKYQSDIPLIYVDNIWCVMTNDGYLNPQQLTFNEIFEDYTSGITIDGNNVIINPSQSLFSANMSGGMYYCISTQPKAFTALGKYAKKILINGIEASVNTTELSLNNDRTVSMIQVGGRIVIINNGFSIASTSFAPGVYIYGIEPLTLTVEGMDLSKIFLPKISHNFYDCPAYEEKQIVKKVYEWDGNTEGQDIYHEVDNDFIKIGSLEEFNNLNQIYSFTGSLSHSSTDPSDYITAITCFKQSAFGGKAEYIIGQCEVNGEQHTLNMGLVVYQDIPDTEWANQSEPHTEAPLTPGVYGFCGGFVLGIRRLEYGAYDTKIHHLDEKFLPEGMMLVPIPKSTDEGAMLQVVDGKPTWVKIPRAEEAVF